MKKFAARSIIATLLVVLIVAALAIPQASAKAANAVFTCGEGDSCPTLEEKFLTLSLEEKPVSEETSPCDDCGQQAWATPGPHSSPLEGCGNQYGEEYADPLPSPIPARNR